MPTGGLDHLNILTRDLAATVAFYEGVLELHRADPPGATMGLRGAWMVDSTGLAIVHIVLMGSIPGYGDGHEIGAPTGAIQHVAFRCTGFAADQTRIAALGHAMRVNDGIAGLRQIMVTDPNGINIEMNYEAD